MTKATHAAFKAAVAVLTADDMTADGLPKMKPLNAALKLAGFEVISTADRDALMEETAPEEAESEAPPTDRIRVIVTASPSDPISLHIHGVGSFKLRIGEEQELPREALDALHNAGGIEYQYEDVS